MAELKDLRSTKRGKSKQKGRPDKGKHGVRFSTKVWEKQIKGQVVTALKQQKPDEQDKNDAEEIRSILNEAESANAANATAPSAAVKLNSILEKRRSN